jgi:two-component system CheB/CheR fusion protein
MATVLIVDDLEDYALVAAVLLRHWGHDVQVAGDAVEALDACRRNRPDVVLLDLTLPGMNGYDLAKQLRDEFGAATPRLIAVSGLSQPNDIRRSADVGIEAHFIKPVDFGQLKACIDGDSEQ